jgi:hypothetical protein
VAAPVINAAPRRWRALLDLVDTLPQRLEVDRPAMFLEQVGESFVGQYPACCLREQVESIPGFLIELNALAGHRGVLPGINSGTLAVPKEADEPVI